MCFSLRRTTEKTNKNITALGLSGVARYSSKQPEPRGGGSCSLPQFQGASEADCRFRGCLFLFFSPHYTNRYTLFPIVRATRFLQKVPSWLLPPFLTGNTLQHAHTQQESIHTPLSQPALPSHTLTLSPTAALDGDGGKHTASSDVSHHTAWCRHFHIPAVIFAKPETLHRAREKTVARLRYRKSRVRVFISSSVLSLRTLAPSTAHHTQPYEHASQHTKRTTRTTQKTGKKREGRYCSSFCCSVQRKFIPIRALDDTRKPSSVHQLALFVTRFKVFDERPSCHGAISHPIVDVIHTRLLIVNAFFSLSALMRVCYLSSSYHPLGRFPRKQRFVLFDRLVGVISHFPL
jgi:hypothetical protein